MKSLCVKGACEETDRSRGVAIVLRDYWYPAHLPIYQKVKPATAERAKIVQIALQ